MSEDNGRYEAVGSELNQPDAADAEGASPAIPAQFRTTVYMASLALTVLTMLVFGLLGVFEVITPDQAAQAITVVTGAVALLVPGLALAYRPTRPGAAR